MESIYLVDDFSVRARDCLARLSQTEKRNALYSLDFQATKNKT